MAANDLETWFYKGQEYVTPKEAARYLGIEHKALLRDILKGRLAVVRVESGQLIEIETLKEFAGKRRQAYWDLFDEWRALIK